MSFQRPRESWLADMHVWRDVVRMAQGAACQEQATGQAEAPAAHDWVWVQQVCQRRALEISPT